MFFLCIPDAANQGKQLVHGGGVESAHRRAARGISEGRACERERGREGGGERERREGEIERDRDRETPAPVKPRSNRVVFV